MKLKLLGFYAYFFLIKLIVNMTSKGQVTTESLKQAVRNEEYKHVEGHIISKKDYASILEYSNGKYWGNPEQHDVKVWSRSNKALV